MKASPVGYCAHSHIQDAIWNLGLCTGKGTRNYATILPAVLQVWISESSLLWLMTWNLGLLPMQTDHNSTDKVGQSDLSMPGKKCEFLKNVFMEPKGWQYHWFITDVHFLRQRVKIYFNIWGEFCTIMWQLKGQAQNGEKIRLNTQTRMGVFAHKYSHIVSTNFMYNDAQTNLCNCFIFIKWWKTDWYPIQYLQNIKIPHSK